MKYLLKTALPCLIGAALAVQTASAQNTYANGDLLLGFELAGQSHDVIFDLGNIAAFSSGTSSFDLTTDGYSAGLVESEFGVSSFANIRWFVAGDDAAGDTVFATRARGANTAFTQSTPFNNTTSSLLGNTAAKIDSMGNLYASSAGGNTFLNGNTTAVNSANANSVTKLQGSAGKFGGTFQNSTLNLVGSGLSVSDLYNVQSTDLGAPAGGSGSFGYFTLDPTTGDMNFVAPEPSTYSLVACAGVLFFIFRRKFRRQAA